MKINSIIDLVKDLDTSRQTKNLNKLLIRILLHLQVEFSKVKMQKAGFYLIENPIKVYWGDISQVQVEYLLFETALSHGPYAYYHLLSGTDLPIKSQDYIHAFFQQNAGKEFVGFWQDAAHQRDLERKVFRYYFLQKG